MQNTHDLRFNFLEIKGENRAARMKNYNNLVRELDSGGAHYSQELSEVDLSDPEDVKVLAADANGETLGTLATVATVWAMIEPLGGRELMLL